ncbi:MAG: bifunctional tRNA (5-methylaminomethyl-2-thiouridine)(34)-methyltransferase MnmD/FAD-dependent 5-carboxymethylaminomethyl-2-thiouridine(34) oxidoreductase MnmC [Marinobacter sp.]|nr:bifunctional tRNA (5-methylaminomethyl-2-thiouridine)(34)-methyltransferase MnmD/FAD-dependent 5-carboxymethylaminomethyl-2-thiouridine(34) oxidoreductase MnmC [Marinobacter sp.]
MTETAEIRTGPASPGLPYADIEWQDGQPVSRLFGDVYFSKDNGLEETRYVFLQHNKLPERFAEVPTGGCFTVAETGFGTGLNFLACWQAWRASHREPGAVLHFVSTEKYPLSHQDLSRALALWPELQPLADALLAQYPPAVAGCHRLVFDEGAVRLTLWLGDALAAFQCLTFNADAWFLDGFAPALNPDLWLDAMAELLAQHSNPGTTLATFTAVGDVRRRLQASGFTMRKVPGYGRKRDMICGEFSAAPSVQPTHAPRTALLIGAGVAGVTLARSLAERGIQVQLIDSYPAPGPKPEINPQGALYVKPGVDYTQQTQLAVTALTFSQRYYRRIGTSAFHGTGLLQLAYDDQEAARQAKLLARSSYPPDVFQPVSAEQATQLTGVPLQRGGLWFPASGWIATGTLRHELPQHPQISCHYQQEVTAIEQRDGQWHATTDCQTFSGDIIALCGGFRTPALLPNGSDYRLKAIRGQVSLIPENALGRPAAVICGQKYLSPALHGQCLVGSTFDLHSQAQEPDEASHRDNLNGLTETVPDIWQDEIVSMADLRGLVGFRCTTHDYQPVAGPLNSEDDGCYVLSGLGSKGLSFAPLLAEWLADVISGQPQCLPLELQRRVAVERCLKTAR